MGAGVEELRLPGLGSGDMHQHGTTDAGLLWPDVSGGERQLRPVQLQPRSDPATGLLFRPADLHGHIQQPLPRAHEIQQVDLRGARDCVCSGYALCDLVDYLRKRAKASLRHEAVSGGNIGSCPRRAQTSRTEHHGGVGLFVLVLGKSE